jgi:hypothetical protein
MLGIGLRLVLSTSINSAILGRAARVLLSALCSEVSQPALLSCLGM